MHDFLFFFKQKTAYEVRISDWSSDVCSSDLLRIGGQVGAGDLDDRDAAGLQPRKMRRLMGIALLLQQNRIVTVLPGRRPFALEVTKIQRGGMRTAHEPHQVRCGQQYPALYSAQRRPPLGTTTS